MAWVRKAGAPAVINMADAFLAEITGDSVWGWLVDWIPLIDIVEIDVDGMCAAGPPAQPELLTPLDFMIPSRPTPLGVIVSKVMLIAKLRDIAASRLFGAYCEGSAVSSWCTLVDRTYSGIPDGFVDLPDDMGGAAGRAIIPAGATKIRMTGWNIGGAGLGDIVFYNATPSFVGGYTYHMALGAETYNIPSGAVTVAAELHGTHPTPRILLEWDCSLPEEFVPTAQPMPTGVLPPVTRIYTTIADLGAELDRQEFKLDHITALVYFLAASVALGPVIADDPVDAEDGVLVDATAIGYRIDITGIPDDADELFGTPPKYHRLGRATIGSTYGWLPSIDLEHTPMLIAPLPPGVDRIQVVVNAPATATVTALHPPK